MRADLALAVDHEAAVGDLAVFDQHRERADMEPDPVLGRGLASRRRVPVVLLPLQILARARRIAVEQARHFRREQHFRAARRRLRSIASTRAPRICLRIDAGGRLEEGDPGHRRDQLVELAGAIERDKIVATADMMAADEDLRDGRAAVGALDHHLARLAAEIDRNLAIIDALGLEQLLGAPAIGAEGLGVDFDVTCDPLTRDT